MRRLLFAAVVLSCGFSGFADDEEIERLAGSPLELAKFVETHSNFEWAPLWRALKHESFLPSCSAGFQGVPPCSSEVITVADPLQLIVILEHESSGFQVFLRYRSNGPGKWRHSGSYSPFVKYFHPEHRVTRLGGKPYLVVTGQGAAGLGVSGKLESWIDLTREKFEPCLSFTSSSHFLPTGDHPGRETRGLMTSYSADPEQSVTVAYHVEFTARAGDSKVRVVERSDKVVYVRAKSGNFEMAPRLSTATKEQVEMFYEGSALDDFDKKGFLRFNLGGLNSVARGNDTKLRDWLEKYLADGPETAESRDLKELMKRR
ncbi:MAG: hypothetical protein U0Q16_35160 [Bryobacteraceae bacterium]